MDEYIRLSNIQANFQKICRTCLIEKHNLQAIFRLVDLLKECTSIQVSRVNINILVFNFTKFGLFSRLIWRTIYQN